MARRMPLIALVGLAFACGGPTDPAEIANGGVSKGPLAMTRNRLYGVGGTISGLSGTVVLQDNAGDNLSRNVGGPFTFATRLPNGSTYSVTVLLQPAGQACTVANGSGTINGSNVTSVAVSCAAIPFFSVGGTVSGLSGTVVLENNGGDMLNVFANGSFAFPTALANGSSYAVTVLTNPAGQTCTVTNASGTVAGANVTNVAVSCMMNPLYSLGGFISGVSGTVVLQDNGGDNLALVADGSFVFATPLANGSSYKVSVLSQPSGQACTVTNGTGTIAGTNVTNVAVTCAAGAYYTLGGSVSGLSGTLVLQDTTGDVLTLTADGPFTFPTLLADGSTYTVWVTSWPSGQTCAIPNAVANGTISGANVTNVAVSCAPAIYSQGYCIVDEVTGLLTGVCMDLYCLAGLSPNCAGTPNGPLVQAACGPLIDSTPCLY